MLHKSPSFPRRCRSTSTVPRYHRRLPARSRRLTSLCLLDSIVVEVKLHQKQGSPKEYQSINECPEDLLEEFFSCSTLGLPLRVESSDFDVGQYAGNTGATGLIT